MKTIKEDAMIASVGAALGADPVTRQQLNRDDKIMKKKVKGMVKGKKFKKGTGRTVRMANVDPNAKVGVATDRVTVDEPMMEKQFKGYKVVNEFNSPYDVSQVAQAGDATEAVPVVGIKVIEVDTDEDGNDEEVEELEGDDDSTTIEMELEKIKKAIKNLESLLELETPSDESDEINNSDR